MELGRYLVHELGCDDYDTLGRWMAHHLAELMDKTENGATKTERTKASKEAVETILKIWERRSSLPGEVYPMTQYREILKVMERLKPENNYFPPLGYQAHSIEEQAPKILFDHLSRLIIALLIRKIPAKERQEGINEVAIDALSEQEQQIMETLEKWLELFDKKNTDTAPKSVNTKKKETNSIEVNLDEVTLELTEATIATLDELRNHLQKQPEKTKKRQK